MAFVEGAIKPGSNFQLNEANPFDAKTAQPNEAARLAVPFPYVGLPTFQQDTRELWILENLPATDPANWGRAYPVPVPANATTTARGIVELATNAETITGTDAERAVVPAALEAWWANEKATDPVLQKIAATYTPGSVLFADALGNISQSSGITWDIGTAGGLRINQGLTGQPLIIRNINNALLFAIEHASAVSTLKFYQNGAERIVFNTTGIQDLMPAGLSGGYLLNTLVRLGFFVGAGAGAQGGSLQLYHNSATFDASRLHVQLVAGANLNNWLATQTGSNFGVGTNAPAQKLDVLGAQRVRNATYTPGTLLDCYDQYSADFAPGAASPFFRCEDGFIINLRQTANQAAAAGGGGTYTPSRIPYANALGALTEDSALSWSDAENAFLLELSGAVSNPGAGILKAHTLNTGGSGALNPAWRNAAGELFQLYRWGTITPYNPASSDSDIIAINNRLSQVINALHGFGLINI